MGTYVVRRLLQMIPVILGSTFLLYALVFALPGDPVQGRCGERPCSAAYVAAFNAEYNLDKPLVVQYALYMGKLVQGDLGTNFYGNRVHRRTRTALSHDAQTGAHRAGLRDHHRHHGRGVLAGIRKGKFLDNLVLVSTLVVISVPIFVIGGVSQLVLGVRLGIFPVTATQGTWDQLLLPGFVLGSVSVAYVSRLTRTSLVENLRSDYVRTAKAKGLTPTRTISVHTLRNSLIPVVTYIGADFGALMGGAVVTERIFNINGVGFFIFRSITQQDGVSVVGAVVCLVIVFLLMNLLVDLLYGVLDPRISND